MDEHELCKEIEQELRKDIQFLTKELEEYMIRLREAEE